MVTPAVAPVAPVAPVDAPKTTPLARSAPIAPPRALLAAPRTLDFATPKARAPSAVAALAVLKAAMNKAALAAAPPVAPALALAAAPPVAPAPASSLAAAPASRKHARAAEIEELAAKKPKADMTTQTVTWKAMELFKALNNNTIAFPKYQRNVVWSIEMQRELVDSMIGNYPVPPFIFAQIIQDNAVAYNVIDGLQRLSAIKAFFDNQLDVRFAGNMKFYKDLDMEERVRFEAVTLSVMVLSNCGVRDEAVIFERINRGKRLTPGELLAACNDTPLARFRDAVLQEFEPALAELWGTRMDTSYCRSLILTNVTGMVAGAAFGPSFITCNYPDLYALMRCITEDNVAEKKEIARRNFQRLVDVWKGAIFDAGALPKKWCCVRDMWSLSTFTGYLLYAFWDMDPDNEAAAMRGMSLFLADCVQNPNLLAELKQFNRRRIDEKRLHMGCAFIKDYIARHAAA